MTVTLSMIDFAHFGGHRFFKLTSLTIRLLQMYCNVRFKKKNKLLNLNNENFSLLFIYFDLKELH